MAGTCLHHLLNVGRRWDAHAKAGAEWCKGCGPAEWSKGCGPAKSLRPARLLGALTAPLLPEAVAAEGLARGCVGNHQALRRSCSRTGSCGASSAGCDLRE